MINNRLKDLAKAAVDARSAASYAQTKAPTPGVKRIYEWMYPFEAKALVDHPTGHPPEALAWAQEVLKAEQRFDAAYEAFDAEKRRVLEEAVGVDLACLWGPRWDEGL